MPFKDVLNADSKKKDLLVDELDNLFRAAPPDCLRDTLMEVYQIYISAEQENGFSVHFPTTFGHMFITFQTLRNIELILADRADEVR